MASSLFVQNDGADSSDGADPVGGTDTPGGATDGDGSLDDERTSGSSTDVENAEGFLANTGANGTVLLVLGGLLSVASQGSLASEIPPHNAGP